jgi:hypothetical protein
MGMESTMDKMSLKDQKKFKGFPLFFTFEKFQTALLGDIKQWVSRQRQCRRCYRRRHRHSRSKCRKQNMVMARERLPRH